MATASPVMCLGPSNGRDRAVCDSVNLRLPIPNYRLEIAKPIHPDKVARVNFALRENSDEELN